MSARVCRLCYGTGERYVADLFDAVLAVLDDGATPLRAEPCPCGVKAGE